MKSRRTTLLRGKDTWQAVQTSGKQRAPAPGFVIPLAQLCIFGLSLANTTYINGVDGSRFRKVAL